MDRFAKFEENIYDKDKSNDYLSVGESVIHATNDVVDDTVKALEFLVNEYDMNEEEDTQDGSSLHGFM